MSHPILVVDDDPNIRRMMTAALCREGYGVLEAANGREALDIMRREKPSVVVLDLTMPLVSGWEVVDECAADPSLNSIPIIIVSANRDPEPGRTMRGISAFLQKPFDLSTLKSLIRKYVRS